MDEQSWHYYQDNVWEWMETYRNNAVEGFKDIFNKNLRENTFTKSFVYLGENIIVFLDPDTSQEELKVYTDNLLDADLTVYGGAKVGAGLSNMAKSVQVKAPALVAVADANGTVQLAIVGGTAEVAGVVIEEALAAVEAGTSVLMIEAAASGGPDLGSGENTSLEGAAKASNIGKVYKGVGTVVESSPISKITGISTGNAQKPNHFMNRVIERGLKPDIIMDTFRNPKVILSQ